MYICDNEHIFEEPKQYIEKHGLDTPPYETLSECPVCGEDYDVAQECDVCKEYFSEKIMRQLDGITFVCPECDTEDLEFS